MNTLQWKLVAPGVWKTTIGNPSELTPLKYMNRPVRLQALERMDEVIFPLDAADITVTDHGGGQVLSILLEEEEELYGTGLQFFRMSQRGRTRYLRVNSDPKQDTGESHAPVPFVVSDKGYGLLIDTSRIVTINCGSATRKSVSRSEEARDRNTDSAWKATHLSDQLDVQLPYDGADVYLFAGTNTVDTVSRYNLYCGGGILPPRWGLGFWHRVPTMYRDEDTLKEALDFRQRDFPCDVIGLEPGWQSRSYPVTNEWSIDRFPDPKLFVESMAKQGFRINLWEHPYISPDSALYSKLEPLSGSHTVWGGIVPDYSLVEAAAVYKEQHDEAHASIGVSGYKLDECDGSELTRHSWMFPAHASFPSGYDGEQMRQLYGLMFQKMTTELFRNRDQRTYGLVRASNAGASSMPYVLYSDLYDHRQFVRALCNSSFCGLLWTPEVRRADNAEDWARRMQTVCFSPLAMLNAWGDGTKPWSYPETEHIVRHYMKLRMRLMPYLYSEFARYAQTGIPPFRAMPLVAGFKRLEGTTLESQNQGVLNTTDAAYGKGQKKNWDDQYMIGDCLLIAPMFVGQMEREVLLPEGVWFGLETGERFVGGEIIRILCGVERIPLFVKEGSILPLMQALPHAPRPGERIAVELVHFGEAHGEYMLYDDDGETYQYEGGDFSWTKLAVSEVEKGSLRGEHHIIAGDKMRYDIVGWQYGSTKLPL